MEVAAMCGPAAAPKSGGRRAREKEVIDGRQGGRGRKEDVEKGEDIEEDCSEIVGLCGAAAVAVLHLLSHPHSSSARIC